MLNTYFIFGIPAILALIYWVTWTFYHKNQSDYLRFTLLLTSTFMTTFSFQVLRFSLQEAKRVGQAALSQTLGYPVRLLWLPLIVGIILVCISFLIVIARVRAIHSKKKQEN